MKPHFTHLLSALFALSSSFWFLPATGLAEEDTEFTIRRYDGIIGDDLKVSLELTRRGEGAEDEWSGSYYYLRHGEPISLTIKGGAKDTLRMEEKSDPDEKGKEKVTAIWEVSLSGNGNMAGTWTATTGKRTLPVVLTEAYPDGSLPFKIHRFARDFHQEVNGRKTGGESTLEFPQATGKSPVVERINATIRSAVGGDNNALEQGSKPAKPPTLLQLKKNFLSSKPFSLPPEDVDFDHVESYDDRWDIMMNSDGILALGSYHYEYTGGIHGNYGSGSLVIDVSTGRPIRLSDFAQPGYQEKWAALGAACLRTDHKLAPKAPLTEAGLFADKLELNDNWCVRPHGIEFSYDPYEIGPYASGFISFVLRWKDILPDLKPGTRIHALATRRTGG